MHDTSSLVEIAAQLADRSRAAIVIHLMDGGSRTGSELALAVNLSPPSASMHLAKLVNTGILTSTRDGRNKYYRIASPAMAQAIEALSTAANLPLPEEARRERGLAQVVNPWAFARTCFDHLAGRLGVDIAAAFQQRDCVRSNGPSGYLLTPKGEEWFEKMGIDCAHLRSERRNFATQCLDWTERRSHIGGALGAALLNGMYRLGWLGKSRIPRLVRLTLKGEEELKRRLSLVVGRALTTYRSRPS